MKKIILILGLIFAMIFAESQTVQVGLKAQVINGEIVRIGIPSKFVRPNGEIVYGGYKNLPDSIHYVDGFRNIIIPAYNLSIEFLTDLHYDSINDVITYNVGTKTQEQLQQQLTDSINALDENFDIKSLKAILRLLINPIIKNDSLTASSIPDAASIYPQYRPGKAYSKGDIFTKDSLLYTVIQDHTSQSDWPPETTKSLYKQYVPPGAITDWVQPTGAQDAYNTGDKVYFNGATYESLIDANVWSPTAYPAGWKQL